MNVYIYIYVYIYIAYISISFIYIHIHIHMYLLIRWYHWYVLNYSTNIRGIPGSLWLMLEALSKEKLEIAGNLSIVGLLLNPKGTDGLEVFSAGDLPIIYIYSYSYLYIFTVYIYIYIYIYIKYIYICVCVCARSNMALGELQYSQE